MKTSLRWLPLWFALLAGCTPSNRPEADTGQTDGENAQPASLSGYFADASYAQRGEGYDWVGVIFRELADGSALVQVRSRADRKKPTCTLDARVYKREDNTYYTTLEGKTILVRVSADTLEILPERPEDEGALYFFCSGGATAAGKYARLDGPLDESQVDKTLFSQVLRLQGIGFHVTAVPAEGGAQLTVTPFGLQISNDPVSEFVDGTVTGAEVEDLNSDGSPELVVYTQSAGSGSYGNVIGFSVNAGKSMSRVHFPPLADNEALNTGYQGHDVFTLAETYLVQRFPIYREGDTNAQPTGGTRQITYKLKEGEAMRQFTVHSVIEY